jgi:hypothetical protein
MKKLYSGKFKASLFYLEKLRNCKLPASKRHALIGSIIPLCFLEMAAPLDSFAQKLELSYSYFNITRNNGGGTLEQGDVIEVHALVKVNAATNNFYYVDTIPTGTQYVSNSLKLVTNEGLLYTGSGPYTDVSNDDAGAYNSAIPAVRVNIGTGFSNAQNGVGFGSTTGGGTVTAGSVPKFYGSTLFIVAYRLLVTANNGDTIHPTGNYFFDSSGTSTGPNRRYRFNYAGIKVIQNQALCNNFSSASFTAESSFGSGSIQNRAAPAIVPGYSKVNLALNNPVDNYYSIANNTSADGTTNNAGPYQPVTNNSRVFGGFWDIVGDHTAAASPTAGNPPVVAGQPGGYMLVVNAAFTTGEVYRDTIKNVCPNTYYEFSAWVRNICGVCGIDKNSAATYTPGVLPNLSFTINDVDYYTTGNIPHDSVWEHRGFIYKTGPTETSFRITIKNNAAGGGGNDWVLDDIKLATCYPNLINSPKDTATSCAGASLTLSDTVKSYFNNYTNFCWEKSIDGVNWMSTGVCGSKVPVLVNGLWEYHVDTSFNTVAADSGTFYRLKVGTTFSNLTDPTCSVNNSQKIYVKVYNVNCTLLGARLISFKGSLGNNNAVLTWTSADEENLKEYVVEKSFDGIHFFTTTIVAASNDINSGNYVFNDPQQITSVAYYRLRLISSTSNANKYSDVIAIFNKEASFKITTENPFRSPLRVTVFVPQDGKVEITLYDAFGRAVSNRKLMIFRGNTEVLMNSGANLAAGMYFLRAHFDNTILQDKLFKINQAGF